MSSLINPFYTSSAYLSKSKGNLTALAPHRERPKILIIPEMLADKPSPCSYIRILNPLINRPIQEHFEIRISSASSLAEPKADIIIINRLACSDERQLDALFMGIVRTGAKLVYEIDDQLLNLHDSHPEAKTYKKRQALVAKLVAAADMVWTSTPTLSKALQPFNKNTVTFENFLSHDLLLPKTSKSPRMSDLNGAFNILYMGTHTHSADLQLTLSALRRLNIEGKNIKLHLVGVAKEIPDEPWINVILPPPCGLVYPLFMQWLRSLPGFNLGIAPLEETEFNGCKSAIKFWDYTTLQIPTLASKGPAYDHIISDGINGYLTGNTAEEWHEKLNSVVVSPEHKLNTVVSSAVATLEQRLIEINGIEKRKEALLNLLGRT